MHMVQGLWMQVSQWSGHISLARAGVRVMFAASPGLLDSRRGRRRSVLAQLRVEGMRAQTGATTRMATHLLQRRIT